MKYSFEIILVIWGATITYLFFYKKFSNLLKAGSLLDLVILSIFIIFGWAMLYIMLVEYYDARRTKKIRKIQKTSISIALSMIVFFLLVGISSYLSQALTNLLFIKEGIHKEITIIVLYFLFIILIVKLFGFLFDRITPRLKEMVKK